MRQVRSQAARGARTMESNPAWYRSTIYNIAGREVQGSGSHIAYRLSPVTRRSAQDLYQKNPSVEHRTDHRADEADDEPH